MTPGAVAIWQVVPQFGWLRFAALPLVALAIVGPMLNVGLGPSDDHELPLFAQRLATIGPLETFLLTDNDNGRFHPAHWILRLGEAAVWGTNTTGWYFDRLLLIVATGAFAYLIARRWANPLVSMLAAAVLLLGPQSIAFSRIGPPEAYAMPVLLAGILLLLRGHPVGVALVAVTVLIKEPFILAAAPIIAWAWWRGYRREAVAASTLVAIAVAGIVVVTAKSGVYPSAGFTGHYLYPWIAVLLVPVILRRRWIAPVLAVMVGVGLVVTIQTTATRAAGVRDFQGIVADVRADGRPAIVNVPNPGYIEYAFSLRRYLPDTPMELRSPAKLPGFGPVECPCQEVWLP